MTGLVSGPSFHTQQGIPYFPEWAEAQAQTEQRATQGKELIKYMVRQI